MSAAFTIEFGTDVRVVPPGNADEAFDVRMLHVLGAGANCATYLGRRPDRSFVAIKAPRWQDAGADLEIEGRILEQFAHPNVVSLLGKGREPGGRRVLVYERLFGNPASVVSRPEVRRHFPDDPGTRFYPLPPLVALDLALDLFSALDHIDRRGFVHHDVKLGNLMVRLPCEDAVLPDHLLLQRVLDGACAGVLVDLGSSRSKAYLAELNSGVADDDLRVVPPQVTPRFAPPEALLQNVAPKGGRPRPLLLPSLDIYAAAAAVYSLATGRVVYDHLGVNVDEFEPLREAKKAEREGKLSPFSNEAIRGAAGWRRVAEDVAKLLQTCVHGDPGKRPRSIEVHDGLLELRKKVGGPRRDLLAPPLKRAPAEPSGNDTFVGVGARDRATIRAKAWELRRSVSETGAAPATGAPPGAPLPADDAPTASRPQLVVEVPPTVSRAPRPVDDDPATVPLQ